MSLSSSSAPRADRFADLFTPKLVTALREGYTLAKLRDDLVAGLTVAVVALPLAMAIAIASGVPPERGLYTAIIGGFIISALGGSRFQIGGPTAAFIVVVYRVVETHGYDGLVLATIMAGLILVAVGLLRLGTYVKYIPFPVVTGFTAGIALSILLSQVAELAGIPGPFPADVPEKVAVLIERAGQAQPATIAVGLVALLMIVGLRRFRPKWPGFLIAVGVVSLAVALMSLDVATIGSRFGGVPRTLPAPALPPFDLAKIRAVLPDALTIAFLAGVESLLSAVVADGMTGRRHRSNVELVAQGVANIASSLFGGISATGAIARTATNIRSGARTPVAGMAHAAILLVFMAVAAPALSYIPLAALAAILTVVAWNIAEVDHVGEILARSSWADRVLLLVTFGLTVFVDLTVAIEVGVVMAALVFVHRMAEAVEVETGVPLIERDRADAAEDEEAPAAPPGVLVYRIDGPFFFGAAQRVTATLERIGEPPRLLIVDFSDVPFMDSTAATAMKSFAAKVDRRHTSLVFAGVRPHVRHALKSIGLKPPVARFAASVEHALAEVR
jgi:SulP family sulfate permease